MLAQRLKGHPPPPPPDGVGVIVVGDETGALPSPGIITSCLTVIPPEQLAQPDAAVVVGVVTTLLLGQTCAKSLLLLLNEMDWTTATMPMHATMSNSFSILTCSCK